MSEGPYVGHELLASAVGTIYTKMYNKSHLHAISMLPANLLRLEMHNSPRTVPVLLTVEIYDHKFSQFWLPAQLLEESPLQGH